jgi:quercetin dioxygenase-like cupin family protein
MKSATCVLGAIALALAMPAGAADMHHKEVSADAIVWGPAPPSLPPGAQAVALLGSPAAEGPFVLRLKLPAGFVVPPHRHSRDELLTVLSGRFSITAAERLPSPLPPGLPPGSFFYLPAGMSHFARAETEAVVQINGVGPFDVVYLDPKDDPRRK